MTVWVIEQRCGATEPHHPHWHGDYWCDGKYYGPTGGN